MVNYPSGYGANQGYNAYSRYAQPIAPSFGTGSFNPYIQQSPQPLNYRATNPYNGSYRPYAQPISPSAWASIPPNRTILPPIAPQFVQPKGGFPGMPYGYRAPQQPVVVTVNAPKWTDDDIKKNFWMKVAATTFSFVAGAAIVGFAAFKIFPRQLFSESTRNLHKSLLENLDEAGIKKLLDSVNAEKFVTNPSKAQKLKAKWGRTSANQLMVDEKMRKAFLNDVSKHVKLINLITTWNQQLIKQTLTEEFGRDTVTPWLQRVGKQTFTQEFADDVVTPFVQRVATPVVEKQLGHICNNLGDRLFTNTVKQRLIDQVAALEPVKAVLAEHNPTKCEFSLLSPEKQQAIMAEVYKHVPLSQGFGWSTTDVVQGTLRDVARGSVSEQARQQLLQKVIEKPGMKDLLQQAGYFNPEKGEKLFELTPEHQKQIWNEMDKHLTIADYLGVTSSETFLNTLKETFVNQDNIGEVMKCVSIKDALTEADKDVQNMSLGEKLAFTKTHLSDEDIWTFVLKASGAKARSGVNIIPRPWGL